MARKPSRAMTAAKTTSMATIEEQLAAEAAGIAEQIGRPGGNKIKLQDKQFVFPDGTADPGPLQLVIVDFVSRNLFYEGKWDPKNPAGPVCFAIGRKIKQLVPSVNSPKRQAKACGECALNEFGSDGDGKACKNTRYLVVLPPDATADTPLMTLEVSPTGLKNYDAYASTVKNLYNTMPVGVITTVSFNPSKTYSSLVFSDPKLNPRLDVFFGRRAEAEALLTAEPDTSFAPKPTRSTRRRARAAA